MSDIEPDEEIVSRIQALLDHEASRDDPAYDGVLGVPPDWVPEAELRRFRMVRNRLLDSFPHWFIIAHMDAYGEDEHPPYPGGAHDVQQFLDDIGTLAQLRYHVRTPRADGVRFYGGENAVVGKNQLDHLADAREAANGTEAEKIQEWRRAIETCEEMLSRNPRRKRDESLYKRVAEKLTAEGHTMSARTVRRAYQYAKERGFADDLIKKFDSG